MSATVVTRYQVNGSYKFSAEIQITGDAAGDILPASAIDMIHCADLTAGQGGAVTEFSIDSVDWMLTGFTGALMWHGTVDSQAVALPQYDGSITYTPPLKNSAGAGKDGDLHIITSGLGIGMSGTIIIKGRHK